MRLETKAILVETQYYWIWCYWTV